MIAEDFLNAQGFNLSQVKIDGVMWYKVFTYDTGFIYVKNLNELTQDKFNNQKFVYLDKFIKFTNEILPSIENDYNEFIQNNSSIPKLWFTADLHIGHKGILKHQNDRGFTQEQIEKHDDWIIDLWNSTVGKKDIIYLIGDIVWFSDRKRAAKLMERLNGKKHVIYGNHDKTLQKITNYFESVGDSKCVLVKKDVYKFLKEDFTLFMSHYPMISWNHKATHSCMLHGHVHSQLDNVNKQSTDLRFDVGIDSELGYHKFVSLFDLYVVYRKKRFLNDDIMFNL